MSDRGSLWWARKFPPSAPVEFASDKL